MAKGKKKRRRSMTKAEVEIAISRIHTKLSDYSVFLYGPPKIGKPTLASEWPNPLFIVPETRGLRAIGEVSHILVHSWPEYVAAIRLARKKRKHYETLVIDTVDLGYRRCFEWCCAKFGFEHPGDEEHGKGWDRIAQVWVESVLEVFDTGLTPIFISHSRDIEVRTRWASYTKTIMSIPTTCRRMIIPLVDMILCMKPKTIVKGKGSTQERRSVICHPTANMEAGDRTGFLPQEVILPKGKGYAAISKAFKAGRKRNGNS